MSCKYVYLARIYVCTYHIQYIVCVCTCGSHSKRDTVTVRTGPVATVSCTKEEYVFRGGERNVNEG